MLTPTEVEELVRLPESERVEKTRRVDRKEKLGEAICAFANDLPGSGKPGYLVVGVTDAGQVVGVEDPDGESRDIADFKYNGRIVPPPILHIESHRVDQKWVVIGVVEPHPAPPVRLDGRVFIRTGPCPGAASEADERLLSERRQVSHYLFDVTPCLESSISDLNELLFRLGYLPKAIAEEVLLANHREFRLQLASLKLFDLRQNCPTMAGILLLCKHPIRFLPNAYIQYVKFDGTTLASPVLFEKQFKEDLATNLDNLRSFIYTNLIKERLPAFGSDYVFNYPKEAIEELVFNAIMHRDYQVNAPIRLYEFEDRIEIDNPGGLYGATQLDVFPPLARYRNPTLAEILHNLGYVNRFGVGLSRVVDALNRNQNPAPLFHTQNPDQFRVVVFNRKMD